MVTLVFVLTLCTGAQQGLIWFVKEISMEELNHACDFGFHLEI